ncbi:hypothetical protein OJ998_16330 [Solirubrobacter taibaiensis]|nr:hypothetical protein [Solirubrobacter taibaiensis]
MPRSARDERIEDLGRALRRLRDLPQAVLVTDEGVWPMTGNAGGWAYWVVEERLEPVGAARLEEAALWRARGALRRVGWTPDAETVVGEGPLKGWRAADVRRVCGAAERAIERLEWAFGDRSGVRPQGVLVAEPVPELRYPSQVPLPRVRCARLRTELAIADRLFDLSGPRTADRWLRSCVARTWPAPAILRELVRLRDDETLRVWALDHGVGDGIGAALRADGADPAAVLETVVDRLWKYDDWREEVLTILLADPEATYHVPARDDWVLSDAGAMLETAGPRWLAATRPHMAAWLADKHASFDHRLTRLPAPLALRMRELWVRLPSESWSPRQLRRYLDLVERSDSATRRRLRQGWIVDVLSSRLGDGAFALLAAAKRVTPGTEDAVAALLAALRPGAGDVQRAIAAWQRERVSEGDERLASATGLDAALIARWRHHRRLLGEPEALPRRAAQLGDLPAKLAAEADAIRARLARGVIPAGDAAGGDRPLDGDAIVDLDRRLARLEDPAAVAERIEATRRRVTRSLERAATDARLRSLRVVLEAQARVRLPGLHDGLPLVLLADLAAMHGLSRAEQRLLERLLDAVFAGDDLDRWPENAAWLARRLPFDAVTWRAGFDATVDGVRYCTEAEPLRALHMGSWFGTCLRLDGGINQFAALNNTIEANRHVVYGYGPRGDVVARRLLAVTDDGTLLKYTTYAFSDREAHSRAMDALCAELAERCGLRLGVQGQPRSLTGSPFYDDGVDRWGPPPEPGPSTSVRGAELQTWPVADAVAALHRRPQRPTPILIRVLRWRGADPAALLAVAEAFNAPTLRWPAFTTEQLIERLHRREAVLELVDRDEGTEAVLAALAERPRDDVLGLAAAALTGAPIRRIRPRAVPERLLLRAVGGTEAPLPALPASVKLDVKAIRRFDAAIRAEDWPTLAALPEFPDDPRFERLLLEACAVRPIRPEIERIAARLRPGRGDSLGSFAAFLLT